MRVPRYLLMMAAAAACDSSAIDWRAHLGRLVTDSNGEPCVVAYRGALSAGDSLWLVSDALDSQQVARAVAGPVGACDALHDELEDVFPVTLTASSSGPLVLGIAAWGPEASVEIQDGLALTDLDHDDEPEFFGFCTSMEGVHLTVWTGPVGGGIRRWHEYHPLFYDVEPSCTEGEMVGSPGQD